MKLNRGTFVEFRTGLINISPIGRNCTQAERDAFSEYNIQHNIVPTMIKLFQEKFGKDVWQCSIGGQISFDLFPKVFLAQLYYKGMDKGVLYKTFKRRGI